VNRYVYDNDLVEEEAFSTWREEVRDEIPGKGDALVELNEYLNWMKTAVEESSSDEDEEDGDSSDSEN
jgi:translation initiation factor 4G